MKRGQWIVLAALPGANDTSQAWLEDELRRNSLYYNQAVWASLDSATGPGCGRSSA